MQNSTFLHFGKNGKASISINVGVDKDISNGAHITLSEELNDVDIGLVGKTRSEYQNAVVLKFYDPKSIDVLISQLRVCKKLLVDEHYRKEEFVKMHNFSVDVNN